MTPRPAIAAVAALGLLANGPCFGDRSTPPVTLRNESDAHVYIKVIGPGGRERGSRFQVGPRAEVLAHQLPSRAADCTRQVLVARTEDGREIDRAAPPLCDGETWVIGD